MGAKPTPEALKMAEDLGLNLVEVSPNARPPVVKIMDYGKYKYRQKKKSQGQKAHQSKVKEVRFHPRTSEHDVTVRFKQIRKFLEQGDKVLIVCLFKGREFAHKDVGYRLMERFEKEFKMLSQVEKAIGMEGRRLTMVLSPLPFEKRKKLEREAQEVAERERREALFQQDKRVRRIVRHEKEEVESAEPKEESQETEV